MIQRVDIKNVDMYNKDSFFSKKLALLYAVLTFLIVLQHSAPMGRFGLAENGKYPFIHCLIVFSYISVPLFFFMSSLLFYRGCEYNDIKRKLLSRVYSLLIPYLLWNTIFVLIYFSITRIPIIEEHMRMGKVLDNPCAFFVAIIDSRFTPLWFVRDLMCFCLFSPLILFIIKKIWLAIIILALSIFATWHWEFSHQNVVTWIPIYLLGAIIGRYLTFKENDKYGCTSRYLVKSRKQRILISMVFGIGFISIYLFSVKDSTYLYFFRLLSPIFLWVILDFALFDYIKKRFRRKLWMHYTFFIYCTHYFVLNVLQKIASLYVEPTTLALNMVFLLSPIITIVTLTYFANFLSKFSFYRYLSGKR